MILVARTMFQLLLVSMMAGWTITSMASETTPLTVTTTAIGRCAITGAEDIRFGAIDPGQAVNVTAGGSVYLSCARGVEFRLQVDQGRNADPASGRRRLRGTSAQMLPYSLTSTALSGIGQGFNAPMRIQIEAAILGADYADLPADTYEDTLRVFVEY